MNRGKPLQRHTPLRAETPLSPMSDRRRAELAEAGVVVPFTTLARPQGSGLASVTPLRRDYTGPTDAVGELVDRRSGGVCEWPDCGRPQQDRHHRLNRKIGGRHGEMRERLNGAAWLLGCCRPHHNMVTSPFGGVLVKARAMGWLLREGQDALVVPVLTGRGWVLLTDDGGAAPVELRAERGDGSQT